LATNSQRTANDVRDTHHAKGKSESSSHSSGSGIRGDVRESRGIKPMFAFGLDVRSDPKGQDSTSITSRRQL
jgi:hypothetical protein